MPSGTFVYLFVCLFVKKFKIRLSPLDAQALNALISKCCALYVIEEVNFVGEILFVITPKK